MQNLHKRKAAYGKGKYCLDWEKPREVVPTKIRKFGETNKESRAGVSR